MSKSSHKKKKKANIARVKARFSEFLRFVKQGEEVTITDRDKPIAKIIPFQDDKVEVHMQKAIENPKGLSRLLKLPELKQTKSLESLALLLADRQKR